MNKNESSEDDGKISYTVKVVDYSGKAQSGVTVQFLNSKNKPDAAPATDKDGVASAKLTEEKYTIALAFAGSKKFYEATDAVVTAAKPNLVLRVTGTKAVNPIPEWYGTTYIVKPGATYVSVKQANVDTFFEFVPDKEGLYRVSVTNPQATVSFWGTPFNPVQQEMAGATSTSYQLNIPESYLGGTYLIGVNGAKEYILVIERLGSAILGDADIPWEPYQGSRPTVKYGKNPGQNLKYVDLTGKTSDFNPVLGTDGVYHLNSATGKILYVNLGPNAQYVSMYSMLGISGVGGTNFGSIHYNKDGSIRLKESYNECMTAYINCRNPQTGSAAFEVYPLTEDLMYMLKNGGKHMGWWDESSGNYLFSDLGSSFNPELGWMFAVCY